MAVSTRIACPESGRRSSILAAFVFLSILIVAGSVVLATSAPARVRFWTWRMRSTDIETRRRARSKLLEVGRPAIDKVFPELVGSEACDRLAAAGSKQINLFGSPKWCVARVGAGGRAVALENLSLTCGEVVGVDLLADPAVVFGPRPRAGSRVLVAGTSVVEARWGEELPLAPCFVMELPDDDELSQRVTEWMWGEWAERRW